MDKNTLGDLGPDDFVEIGGAYYNAMLFKNEALVRLDETTKAEGLPSNAKIWRFDCI